MPPDCDSLTIILRKLVSQTVSPNILVFACVDLEYFNFVCGPLLRFYYKLHMRSVGSSFLEVNAKDSCCQYRVS